MRDASDIYGGPSASFPAISSAPIQEVAVDHAPSSESVSKAKPLKPNKEVVAIAQRCQKSLAAARVSETAFFKSGSLLELKKTIDGITAEIAQRRLELVDMRKAQLADPALMRDKDFSTGVNTAALRLEELVTKKAALEKLAANSQLQKTLAAKKKINELLDKARVHPADAGEHIFKAQQEFDQVLRGVRENSRELAPEVNAIEARLFKQSLRLEVSKQHHNGISRFIAHSSKEMLGPLDSYRVGWYERGLGDPTTDRFKRASSALTTMLARSIAFGKDDPEYAQRAEAIKVLRKALKGPLSSSQQSMLEQYDRIQNPPKGGPPLMQPFQNPDKIESDEGFYLQTMGVGAVELSRKQRAQSKIKLTFTDRIRTTGGISKKCDTIASDLNQVSLKALKMGQFLTTSGEQAAKPAQGEPVSEESLDFESIATDIHALKGKLQSLEREIAIVAADPRLKNSQAANRLDEQAAKLKAQLNTLEAQSAALQSTFSKATRDIIQLRGQISACTAPPLLLGRSSTESMERFTQALTLREQIVLKQTAIKLDSAEADIVHHEVAQADLLISSSYMREMQEVNGQKNADEEIRAEMAKVIPEPPSRARLTGYARRLMLRIGTPDRLKPEGDKFRDVQERSSAIEDVERLRAQLGEESWNALVGDASIKPLLARYENAQAQQPTIRLLAEAHQAEVALGLANMNMAATRLKLAIAQTKFNPQKPSKSLKATIESQKQALSQHSAQALRSLVAINERLVLLKEAMKTDPSLGKQVTALETAISARTEGALEMSADHSAKLADWQRAGQVIGKQDWSADQVKVQPDDFGTFKEVYKNALGRALYRQQQADVNELNLGRLQAIAQKNPQLRAVLDKDPEVGSLEKSRVTQTAAKRKRDADKPWLAAKAYREFSVTTQAGTGEISELAGLLGNPEFQKQFSEKERELIVHYASNLQVYLQYEEEFRDKIAELEASASSQEAFFEGLHKLFVSSPTAKGSAKVMNTILGQTPRIEGLVLPMLQGSDQQRPLESRFNQFRADRPLDSTNFALKALWGGKQVSMNEVSFAKMVQRPTRRKEVFEAMAKHFGKAAEGVSDPAAAVHKSTQEKLTATATAIASGVLSGNQGIKAQEHRAAVAGAIATILTSLSKTDSIFTSMFRRQSSADRASQKAADEDLRKRVVAFNAPSTTIRERAALLQQLTERLARDPEGLAAVGSLTALSSTQTT